MTSTREWRTQAACRWEDPDLFFPIGNTGPALLQIEEAKTVCRRCPVQEHCLTWALESGQDTGVWGGLSEDERRAMVRRAARARSTHHGDSRIYPQNKRVLEAWAAGLTEDEIAELLDISRKSTLENLRKLRKILNVPSNAELVHAAHAAGLLDTNGAAA